MVVVTSTWGATHLGLGPARKGHLWVDLSGEKTSSGEFGN